MIQGAQLANTSVIVTGAGGKLGRILRRAWSVAPPVGLAPVWLSRSDPATMRWDLLKDPSPDLPQGAVVLHLAGITRGDADTLRQNADLVPPLLAACRKNRAKALILVSTAAVYRPSEHPVDEMTDPDPQGAYGRSKHLAEAAACAFRPDCPVTILRLGNVVGADALLAAQPPRPIILDPVPGHDGGPLRSWIGPLSLATVLARLCQMAGHGPLPDCLNLAQQPPLHMADLLHASGRPWRYGPANPSVIPAAVMATDRLQSLMPVPTATADGLLAELRLLDRAWQ